MLLKKISIFSLLSTILIGITLHAKSPIEVLYEKEYANLSDKDYTKAMTQPLFKQYYGTMQKKDALDKTFTKTNCKNVAINNDECYEKVVTFNNHSYKLNLVFNIGFLSEVVLIRETHEKLPSFDDFFDIFKKDFLPVASMLDDKGIVDFVANKNTTSSLSKTVINFTDFRTKGKGHFMMIYVEKKKPFHTYTEKDHLLEMYSSSTKRYAEIHIFPFKDGYIEKIIFANFLSMLEINNAKSAQKNQEKF